MSALTDSRFNPRARVAPIQARPAYYECGICSAWHDARWDGDCRQDSARFDCEALDVKHGATGWDAIEMDDVDSWRARNGVQP